MRIVPALLLLLLPVAAAAAAPAASSPWLSQPALSPDGREIAFVAGGDIWSVPEAGGEAHLLVSSPADDRRPLWSPDGAQLAFVSDRTGNGDLYVLTLATGALRRVTFDDATESLDAWSPDGRWLYYSSVTGDIAGMNDIWRVPVEGGTPVPVSAERYTNEFAAAPSPDGAALLLDARGIASAQWWRKGHSHIDDAEIWLMRPGASPAYTKLVDPGAKALWPMWAPDGKHFYFMGDSGGAENLWSADLEGHAAKLTDFTSGRVLWPTIARDGSRIVFERDFGLWTLDLATREARPLPVALRGAAAGAGREYRRLTNGIQEMALSPDGRKIAFVVHGEVFAVSAADGGDAERVTRTPGPESQVAWSPDSRAVVFSAAADGAAHVVRHDFVGGKDETLTSGAGVDMRPQFSPDGKQLAYVRDGRELRVLDLATRADRAVATGRIDLAPPLNTSRPFAWSRDGRWIAFMAMDEHLFRNAFVVEVAAKAPQAFAASGLANLNNDTVDWSGDGSFLVFDTGQRTEPGQVARVDLVPHTPRFREQLFRDLFQPDAPRAAAPKDSTTGKSAKPAKAPSGNVEIVREGLRQRLTLLPLDLDVQSVKLSADGKLLLVVASAAGQENLWTYSLDELAKEPAVPKQVTSTSGHKASAQLSPDGKTAWCLDDGAIVSIPLDTRTPRPLAVSAAMDVDFEVEKNVVFEQAWSWLGTHFHDPKMNGADWPAVRERFAPRVAAERTTTELDRLLSMMVGELNASHLGVRPPGRPARTTGRLGLRFDPEVLARNGELRIAEVVPNGPADVTRRIHRGDRLVAVDGAAVGRGVALEALLENKIGKEVRLTLAPEARGAKGRDVPVRPVDQGVEKNLLYRAWVERNRALVSRLSGGKLGYVHMADMSYDALLRLAGDLDSDNLGRDGVVIDVRNNNGGFVNAYALDVLARRHYLNMTQRGWPTAHARGLLGQRALEKPTVLLTNPHSLSDAEDFSEGYRALGLGKVVGEPTAGWIIYTADEPMLDGSVLRLPCITITTAAGEPMEMHPRPVDVEVRRALGEDAAGRDSQIERAVAELMKAVASR